MSKVVVAGVPEHFNYSWHIALNRGIFTKHGVEVQWKDVKEGTGAMITQLKNGEVDLIIALTEGLVSEICKGSDIKLLGTYVRSPLCWAISTGKNSKFNTVEELKGQKFGISRFTSGSHLMVCVLALERGWHPQNDVSFEVKGSFDKLRDGVNDNTTAAFLWETFTTKPFHDSGEIRRIGDITTPWPCFMIASRSSVVDEKLDSIKKVLTAIREATSIFHTDTDMPQHISENYGLQLEDAKKWYSTVKITGSKNISEASLQRAVYCLYQAKILETNEFDFNKFIDPRIARLKKDIQFVKLYNKPELIKAIRNNLKANGIAKGPLNYEQLLPYDQHHYHGTNAIDLCIKEGNFTKDSNIINIGSGLGGPARYIAGKFGSRVLGIELQLELHRTALELTERCGLRNKVRLLCGDVLEIGEDLNKSSYDGVVAWLTFLHIPNRKKLFQVCYDVLKPGGLLITDDFFERKPLREEEKKLLAEEVYCSYLPDLATYKKDLEQAGFELVKVEDVTEDWRDFTKKRVEDFDANKKNLLGIHREDTYNRLRYFYNIVKELYSAGNLGGVHLVAKKP
eukprot:TRINITY_DN6248_c0_g1_i1.p1 TRINITY_DN6248_c0_g1~~TRINITY_DN6248_c0_g1_i1.p1  ORF type:complete len:568 (-),score=83.11 TRINITY_DN6248_c0_g1_i1:63-1766(-)